MLTVLRWPLLALGSLFVFSLVVATALLLEPALGEQLSSLGKSLMTTTAGLPGFAALPAIRSLSASGKAQVSNPIHCDAGPISGYEQCSYAAGGGESEQFLLHVPRSYDPHKKYPLVLVLHGGGERAKVGSTTNEACATLEKAPYVRAWVADPLQKDSTDVQSRWPSFIVVPLLTGQNRWVDVPPSEGSHKMAESPTPQLRDAKSIVDTLRGEYEGVDANRIYITGVSLGGYGTWEAIERWPGYFAAAVPVSGAGDPSRAAELKSLPIWVFHGAADRIVPVSGSRDMVAALRADGADPRYTEYPGAGHDIWAKVYSVSQPLPTTRVFEWLFSQHRSDGGAKVAG